MGAAPTGMVFVPGGRIAVGVAKPLVLPDYWIDKFEVTNKDFKRFVDAGGYRDRKHWKQPFRDGTRLLEFEQVMGKFKDSTGQPDPRRPELGSYQQGHEDFPVGGISWFEAAAYAEFAGKSLLTFYHWFNASGVDEIFSDMLLLSHFDAKGAASGGARQHRSVGRLRHGRQRERVVHQRHRQRHPPPHIVGGSWNELAHGFYEPEGRNLERHATFGVRLMKTTGEMAEATAPILRDWRPEQPRARPGRQVRSDSQLLSLRSRTAQRTGSTW